jgi:Fe-S-cluster containining protein
LRGRAGWGVKAINAFAIIMKKTNDLFRSYELLVDKAEAAFQGMQKDHSSCIKCEPHCSDCCHAIFGLFLIEAGYLKEHLDELTNEEKRAALLRCEEAEKSLERLQKMLQAHEGDPQMQAYIMSRERIPCPLLNENQDCILYPYRPITCRVYGIPTKVQGKARVCWKAEFKKDERYPVFDLDGAYRDLYFLSTELLKSAGKDDPERASLLISVSKAITTSLEDLTGC